MTTTTLRIPTTLDELVAVLQSLGELPPIERARFVRRLDRPARAILGNVGDAAVFEATNELVDGVRRRTYAEIGAALGVTDSRINNVVYQHRRRIEEQQRATASRPRRTARARRES